MFVIFVLLVDDNRAEIRNTRHEGCRLGHRGAKRFRDTGVRNRYAVPMIGTNQSGMWADLVDF